MQIIYNTFWLILLKESPLQMKCVQYFANKLHLSIMIVKDKYTQ